MLFRGRHRPSSAYPRYQMSITLMSVYPSSQVF